MSIGIASAHGKAHIHGVGVPEDIWTADHDSFLECMVTISYSRIPRPNSAARSTVWMDLVQRQAAFFYKGIQIGHVLLAFLLLQVFELRLQLGQLVLGCADIFFQHIDLLVAVWIPLRDSIRSIRAALPGSGDRYTASTQAWSTATGSREAKIVGRHLQNYDSMLMLSHFKGHAMGGFGGALKNMSIGIASAHGKAHIHALFGVVFPHVSYKHRLVKR